MLSVFMTPWTKPTRSHSHTMSAVRRTTSSKKRAYRSGDELPDSVSAARSGKSALMTKSVSVRNVSMSPREAKISKFPNRTNDGATRQTTAPGSSSGWPS